MGARLGRMTVFGIVPRASVARRSVILTHGVHTTLLFIVQLMGAVRVPSEVSHQYLAVIPSTKVNNAAMNLSQIDLHLCGDDTRLYLPIGEIVGHGRDHNENAGTEQTHPGHA